MTLLHGKCTIWDERKTNGDTEMVIASMAALRSPRMVLIVRAASRGCKSNFSAFWHAVSPDAALKNGWHNEPLTIPAARRYDDLRDRAKRLKWRYSAVFDGESADELGKPAGNCFRRWIFLVGFNIQ
jgi:hypothetical protein